MTKVAATEQAYDDDGNLLTSSEGLTLVWDGENRLFSSTKDNVTTTYQYDCLSRRTSKETNGVTTRFLYDGWNMVVEYAGDVVDTRYTWGMDLSGSMQGAGGVGGLLAVTDASSNHSYPTYDGNGNVSEQGEGTSLLDTSTAQCPQGGNAKNACFHQYLTADSNIVAHYEYDAFGNEIESKTTGASANDYAHKFSTKYQDEETDYYYYGYRYYDPVTGTWLSRDPIEEEGGCNLYGFLGNDSINLADILGLNALGNPNEKRTEENKGGNCMTFVCGGPREDGKLPVNPDGGVNANSVHYVGQDCGQDTYAHQTCVNGGVHDGIKDPAAAAGAYYSGLKEKEKFPFLFPESGCKPIILHFCCPCEEVE